MGEFQLVSVVIEGAGPQRVDALNAICPYWTMFPLSFPMAALAPAGSSAEGPARHWVLDPFCGRGTTLFAARKLGLPAVGIDSNEVAVAIAAAKLVAVEPAQVLALAARLIDSSSSSVAEGSEHTEQSIPDGEFWQWCFAPGVLRKVCALRAGLMGWGGEVAAALRGVLLGALHGPRNKGAPSYFSNQMPRTYSTKPRAALSFWKKHDLRPVEVDVLEIIARHAVRRYAAVPPRTPGAVYCGDSLAVLSRMRRRFRWVITSPPYPGMITYRPDGWLRGWLLGGPPQPDYSRADQLGAVTGIGFVEKLADIWSAVAARCHPSAQLVVRFGALPSARSGEPEDLLIGSLELSGAWRAVSVKDAGVPRRAARQAEQALKAGAHVHEVDVMAVRRD
jgi:hypothetical protein